MRTVCAYCGVVIDGALELDLDDDVSHGVCPECVIKEREKLKELDDVSDRKQ